MDRATTFMQKRCIKLPDGRYLIFYTFDDERSGAEKELETTPRDNEDKSKEESLKMRPPPENRRKKQQK